jgi:putative serine/threonine protein kinase
MTTETRAPLTLTLEQLREESYASVLCYPKPVADELESRIAELKRHNVTAVELSGKVNAYGIPAPILGKGYVGIVVIAYVEGQRIALKIRRVDADRADLYHEAQMLEKANTVGVGPRFIGVSKNFLLMQLIEGDLLPAWLNVHKEKLLVQKVTRSLLESCYRLDKLGLDHGELSKAPKHVIIDQQQNPFIVDFETASVTRRTANLQAICHFLFTSKGEAGQAISKVLGERKNDEIVKALQEYKKNKTRSNFESVLQVCLD